MAPYGWIAFIYMRFYYFESTAPTKYDALTRQIYQVKNHAYCFYLALSITIIALTQNLRCAGRFRSKTFDKLLKPPRGNR